MRPRLHLLATGGTISMVPTAAGNVPSLDGAALLALAAGAARLADVTVEDWARIPAAHLDGGRLVALRDRVAQLQRSGACDGIVITHGTDTIEETAYLLARTVAPEVPVVVTGAMRTSADADWDGGRNLGDALRVAAATASRGRGVLVAFAGSILAGHEAVKRDALALDAFHAPHGAPLGAVAADGTVAFTRTAPRADRFAAFPARGVLPPVTVHALVPADDGALLYVSRASHAGAVLLGFGAGNLTPGVLSAAERWLADGKPVVLASRCASGEVAPLYGFPGGSRQAIERGLLPAGPRTPWQARIELQLCLAMGMGWEGEA
ncbi:MAG: asparaginase [Gemmatimonadales bacterium]|nr:asparaginase [Gemmatimonadales bacterium]